jgi:hypothetical protein
MGFPVFADNFQKAILALRIDIGMAEEAVTEQRECLTRNVRILSPDRNHSIHRQRDWGA